MAGKKSKYLWFTDTHLNRVSPLKKILFIHHILKENPKAIFFTGDISCGATLYYDLYLLGIFIKCPIYFILGNHDYWYSDIYTVEKQISKICRIFPQFIWLTKSDPIPLNDEVAIIGDEGWYDGYNGNNNYLKFTLDQYAIKDFRKVPTLTDKLNIWREMANKSNLRLKDKLTKAFDKGYKTVYVLTHFPPFKEATRDQGTLLEKFWLPYNTNIQLGKLIESTMKNVEGRVIMLCGHIHSDATIHVTSNIECKTNKEKTFGWLRNEELIFI